MVKIYLRRKKKPIRYCWRDENGYQKCFLFYFIQLTINFSSLRGVVFKRHFIASIHTKYIVGIKKKERLIQWNIIKGKRLKVQPNLLFCSNVFVHTISGGTSSTICLLLQFPVCTFCDSFRTHINQFVHWRKCIN